jgi:hypothetical protein
MSLLDNSLNIAGQLLKELLELNRSKCSEANYRGLVVWIFVNSLYTYSGEPSWFE